ncbi:hypothetical protein LIA77_02202 [Sarocladium implicatum]|nr:hypothetical protein LIA77_02202 [Sarocladium implicatum]
MSYNHNLELTLFLWPEGYSPKRVAYYLLAKGLVASATDLVAGVTSDPNLLINIIELRDGRLVDVNSSDPRPAGKSTPCLRIVDRATGSTTWLHESAAIPIYLEELYPDLSPLQGRLPLERALMHDIMAQYDLALAEGTNYLKNATSVTTMWSGMRDEDRSHSAALYGKANVVKSLFRMQDRARESLAATGWLTPGVNGPGLVDVSLAALAWYQHLCYGWDIFADESLSELRKWYGRFKELSWWITLEQSGILKPFQYPEGCLEV